MKHKAGRSVGVPFGPGKVDHIADRIHAADVVRDDFERQAHQHVVKRDALSDVTAGCREEKMQLIKSVLQLAANCTNQYLGRGGVNLS